MSDYVLELISADGNSTLVSRYANQEPKPANFKAECIKAAEAIAKARKNTGIVLFLENTFESLVMLEAFLETGVRFEAATLSVGRLTSPVTAKWKSRLEEAGIKLTDIRFDLENKKHLEELDSLQLEYSGVHIMGLLRMWSACRFDKFVVFSGDLCIPQLDAMDKVASWGLPDKRQLAFYNFSKSFYVEPFFMISTHGLFRAQVESEFSAAIIDLYRNKERGLLNGYFQAKKIWYEQTGFKKLASWPVSEESEAIWQSALRFEDRYVHENFYFIIDRIRNVKDADIKELTEIDSAEVENKFLHSESYQSILSRLLELSSDINTTGAAAHYKFRESAGDEAYAIFPYLMLQSEYEKDVAPLRDALSKIEFYHNTSNLISSTDLHLKSEFAELTEFFNEKIRRYYEVQGKAVREFEITHCWANLAKVGGAHHYHRHPNSMLSGVFYLNDGGGGDTVFKKEIPENMVVYLTQKTQTPFNSLSVKVRPKSGKLILFPSFISHEVMPHVDTQQSRYTIAFNVFVRDSLGSFSAGSWLDLRNT